MALLILVVWILPARAQDSINLDFTVAQTDQSHSEPAVATLSIASPSETNKSELNQSESNKSESNKDDDRKQDAIALSFAVPDGQAAVAPKPSPPVQTAVPAVVSSDLFAGGSDSLVARTVGHAEGTRTADGHKTRAYYGHSDPGNGVWNLGSFSYQHAAQSPEDADEKQLRRLQAQADTIRQRAASHRLTLSLEEELNAVDLANQAPLAALDTPGYVEWLKQAHDRGLKGADAVLWARTQSYWNPRRNRWEAPGLGNTEDGINHDQNRRLTAIARALDTYQQQAAQQQAHDQQRDDQQQNDQQQNDQQDKIASKPPQEQMADYIIFQDLSTPKGEAVAQVRR